MENMQEMNTQDLEALVGLKLFENAIACAYNKGANDVLKGVGVGAALGVGVIGLCFYLETKKESMKK